MRRNTRRKFTGGVCEIEAALEFVRNNVKAERGSGMRAGNDKSCGIRRSQRLNQKTYIKQKA
jgi:hypothetical protein